MFFASTSTRHLRVTNSVPRPRVPGRLVPTLAALCIVGLGPLGAGCSSDDTATDAANDSAEDSGSGATSTAAESGPSGEFSVLAYNVAGLPQEISKENPKEHIPLISPLLEPYDVVLTQEDFDWWQGLAAQSDFVNYHDRLRTGVTHEFRTAKHPGPEAVGVDTTTRDPLLGDGQGILSRFAFTDERRVPWQDCFGGFDTSDGGAADCLAMKGFAVVTMTLADGIEVDVYTLHLEAGGTERDQEIQQAGMAQLSAFIDDHSAGRAVIVGGDTNLHLDETNPDASGSADREIWEQFLSETGLADVCVTLDCSDPNRIDKFAMRSSDAVTLTPTSYEVPGDTFTAPDGAPLSDHEPVAIEVSWSA